MIYTRCLLIISYMSSVFALFMFGNASVEMFMSYMGVPLMAYIGIKGKGNEHGESYMVYARCAMLIFAMLLTCVMLFKGGDTVGQAISCMNEPLLLYIGIKGPGNFLPTTQKVEETKE